MRFLQFFRSEWFALLFRYGIVGLIASLLHFGVSFYCESVLKITPLLAHFYGFILGLISAYFGHYFYSFKDSEKHSRRFPKFVIVALTALFLHEIGVYILVEVYDLNYTGFVLPLLLVSVPLLTFSMSRFWVFTESK